MTNRDLLASADPATFVHEATQETEDQVGLDSPGVSGVSDALLR